MRKFLVVVLVSMLLVITLFGSGTIPGNVEKANASTCGYWTYHTGQTNHGSWNWNTTLTYYYESDNCHVIVTYVRCSWWGIGVTINKDYCGAWYPFIDHHYEYIEYAYTITAWFVSDSEYTQDIADLWGQNWNLHVGQY